MTAVCRTEPDIQPLLGALAVGKFVDPIDSQGTFTFNIAGPNGYSNTVTINYPAGTNPVTVNGLAPGAYTVTEQTPAGSWTTEVSCDGDAAQPGNVGTSTVTAGGQGGCLFLNTTETVCTTTETEFRRQLLDRRDGYGRNAGAGSESWPLACPATEAEFRQFAESPDPLWIDLAGMPSTVNYAFWNGGGPDTPVNIESNKVITTSGIPHTMTGSGLSATNNTGTIGRNVIVNNVCIEGTNAGASDESGRGLIVNRFTDVWVDHVTVRSAYDEGITFSSFAGYDGSQGPLNYSVSHSFSHSRQGRNYSFLFLPNNPANAQEGPPAAALGDTLLNVTGWRNCSDDRTQPFNGDNAGPLANPGFRSPLAHGVNLEWVNNSVHWETVGALIEDYPETTGFQNGFPNSHWGSQYRSFHNVYESVGTGTIAQRRAGQSPLTTGELVGNLYLGGGVEFGWTPNNTTTGIPSTLNVYQTEVASQANRAVWEAECGCQPTPTRADSDVCLPGEPGGVADHLGSGTIAGWF